MYLCQNFNRIFTRVSITVVADKMPCRPVISRCMAYPSCCNRKTQCTKGIYIKALPFSVRFELHVKVLGDLMLNISIIVS